MATNYFDTSFVTQVVQNILKPSRPIMDRIFTGEEPPRSANSDEIVIDFAPPARKKARFSKPDSDPQRIEEQGFRSEVVKPAYLKLHSPLDINRTTRRARGESVGGGDYGISERERMCVVDQTAYLIDLYMNQLEWMACQCLTSASYDVAYYEGTEVVETETLSFGRHSDLTYDRTGNNQWSNDASNPVEDLREATDRIAMHAGAVSEPIVICGWRAFGDLISHDDVKVDLDSKHLTDIMLAAGAGKTQGLHPAGQIAGFSVFVHHDFYEDDDGNLQRYIPTDSVHMVSVPEYLGTLARGAIRDSHFSGAQRMAEYAVRTWLDNKSGQRNLLLQAAPLVYAKRANASCRINTRA